MIYLDQAGMTLEQEAEALMFYHLKMAARFFENTGLSHNIPNDDFSSSAMAVWLGAMNALYPEEDI